VPMICSSVTHAVGPSSLGQPGCAVHVFLDGTEIVQLTVGSPYHSVPQTSATCQVLGPEPGEAGEGLQELTARGQPGHC
jgi:hypothetical protein